MAPSLSPDRIEIPRSHEAGTVYPSSEVQAFCTVPPPRIVGDFSRHGRVDSFLPRSRLAALLQFVQIEHLVSHPFFQMAAVASPRREYSLFLPISSGVGRNTWVLPLFPFSTTQRLLVHFFCVAPFFLEDLIRGPLTAAGISPLFFPQRWRSFSSSIFFVRQSQCLPSAPFQRTPGAKCPLTEVSSS